MNLQNSPSVPTNPEAYSPRIGAVVAGAKVMRTAMLDGRAVFAPRIMYFENAERAVEEADRHNARGDTPAYEKLYVFDVEWDFTDECSRLIASVVVAHAEHVYAQRCRYVAAGEPQHIALPPHGPIGKRRSISVTWATLTYHSNDGEPVFLPTSILCEERFLAEHLQGTRNSDERMPSWGTAVISYGDFADPTELAAMHERVIARAHELYRHRTS